MRISERTDNSTGQNQPRAFTPALLTANQSQAQKEAIHAVTHNIGVIIKSGNEDTIRPAKFLLVSGLQYLLVSDPVNPSYYCYLLNLLWLNLNQEWAAYDKWGNKTALIDENKPFFDDKSPATLINEELGCKPFYVGERCYGRLIPCNDSNRIEVERIPYPNVSRKANANPPSYSVILIEEHKITRCIEVTQKSIFGLQEEVDLHFINQLIKYAIIYFANRAKADFSLENMMGGR